MLLLLLLLLLLLVSFACFSHARPVASI